MENRRLVMARILAIPFLLMSIYGIISFLKIAPLFRKIEETPDTIGLIIGIYLRDFFLLL